MRRSVPSLAAGVLASGDGVGDGLVLAVDRVLVGLGALPTQVDGVVADDVADRRAVEDRPGHPVDEHLDVGPARAVGATSRR